MGVGRSCAIGVDKDLLSLTSPAAGGGGPKLEMLPATSRTSGWGRTAHISKSQSRNELLLVLLGSPGVKCPQIQLEAVVDFCGVLII